MLRKIINMFKYRHMDWGDILPIKWEIEQAYNNNDIEYARGMYKEYKEKDLAWKTANPNRIPFEFHFRKAYIKENGHFDNGITKNILEELNK